MDETNEEDDMRQIEYKKQNMNKLKMKSFVEK